MKKRCRHSWQLVGYRDLYHRDPVLFYRCRVCGVVRAEHREAATSSNPNRMESADAMEAR